MDQWSGALPLGDAHATAMLLPLNKRLQYPRVGSFLLGDESDVLAGPDEDNATYCYDHAYSTRRCSSSAYMTYHGCPPCMRTHVSNLPAQDAHIGPPRATESLRIRCVAHIGPPRATESLRIRCVNGVVSSTRLMTVSL